MEFKRIFKVIDKMTGKEADPEEIALNEAWADGLIYCDMEGFAVGEDGRLYLLDECGRFEYAPSDRFEVVWDAEDVDVPAKWIPIEGERKPRYGQECYIAYVFGDDDTYFVSTSRYYRGKGSGCARGNHFTDEGVGDLRVTHWMPVPPLPQPPKGVE